MQSLDPIDTRTLTTVSKHLDKEWRAFMRILEFSVGEIDQMYERFSAVGPTEAIFRLLLQWNRNDDDATVGKLCRLLWKNQQQHCVMILREQRKRCSRQSNQSDENGNGGDDDEGVEETANGKQADSDSLGSDIEQKDNATHCSDS